MAEMTELLRNHAKNKGEGPDSVAPLRPRFAEIARMLQDLNKATFTAQRRLIEAPSRVVRSLRRQRLMLLWALRLFRLFVFLIVFAIGADLLSGLEEKLWRHLLIVTLLWVLEELLANEITRQIEHRRLKNLRRFTVSFYQEKMQSLCDIATWEHRFAERREAQNGR